MKPSREEKVVEKILKETDLFKIYEDDKVRYAQCYDCTADYKAKFRAYRFDINTDRPDLRTVEYFEISFENLYDKIKKTEIAPCYDKDTFLSRHIKYRASVSRYFLFKDRILKVEKVDFGFVDHDAIAPIETIVGRDILTDNVSKYKPETVQWIWKDDETDVLVYMLKHIYDILQNGKENNE